MTELLPILLAEDSPEDIELMLEALSQQNLANRVVVVHDGVEALDYLRHQGAYADRASGDPVVVILDIKMPRKDGLQVLREIRSDPELKMAPVVVLTSSREQRDLITSYELGVNAYVVKPIEFTQFIDAVKEIGVFWALINQPPVRASGREA
jgi:CheY-like chemotaxis protein